MRLKSFLLLGLLLGTPFAAVAEKADAPAAKPVAPAAPPVSVTGFRSARFGMSQDDTLKAIKTDFNLSGTAVTHQDDVLQGTHALSIIVPGLLPNSGHAVVSYVFGYKSNDLEEVDVRWAAAAPGNSPKVLLQTGATLQNFFLGENFTPDSRAGTALLGNGNLLLFRGADAQGHAVALYISGPSTHDAKANKTDITPALLTLAYIQDPLHPDVFKIQPGAF
jgi:hypothetical protein